MRTEGRRISGRFAHSGVGASNDPGGLDSAPGSPHYSAMPDGIGSTSWPNRNRAHFENLNRLLLARGDARPARITLVGPGAVTRLLRPLLNDAAHVSGAPRKLLGDLARYTDQLIRRIPMLSLMSLEAIELEQTLTTPHALTVADVSPRVLEAVSRDLPHARTLRLDLSIEPLVVASDVVIAFNVLSRVDDGARAAANLLASLAVGGLVLMDDRSAGRVLANDAYELVAPKIRRRMG